MIEAEKKLEELFDTLPAIVANGNSYKPTFDFGTHTDLLRFLKYKHKEDVKFYPLIWMETPITLKGKEHRKQFDLKLVLAERSNAQMSNKERLETTFKIALNPLYKNILKALKQGPFTKIINEEDNLFSKHFNYGVKEKGEKNTVHGATDIWDAIKFECKIEITKCDEEIKINY